LFGKASKFLSDKYFAALQLNAIHVIFFLQRFCCSAAFLSGSAALIFGEKTKLKK
jgi:hypothetical protein